MYFLFQICPEQHPYPKFEQFGRGWGMTAACDLVRQESGAEPPTHTRSEDPRGDVAEEVQRRVWQLKEAHCAFCFF